MSQPGMTTQGGHVTKGCYQSLSAIMRNPTMSPGCRLNAATRLAATYPNPSSKVNPLVQPPCCTAANLSNRQQCINCPQNKRIEHQTLNCSAQMTKPT